MLRKSIGKKKYHAHGIKAETEAREVEKQRQRWQRKMTKMLNSIKICLNCGQRESIDYINEGERGKHRESERERERESNKKRFC